MASRLLNWLHRKPSTAEGIIDDVITDISHKLTESRIQLLAAELARKKLNEPSECNELRQGVASLEHFLNKLILKRNDLVIKARDAEARLSMERLLMEIENHNTQAAFDSLIDHLSMVLAEADAITEVRQISHDNEDNTRG